MALSDWIDSPRVEERDEERKELKEKIKDLRVECEEYQKRLDNIDLQAMCIQNLVKKIREKI